MCGIMGVFGENINGDIVNFRNSLEILRHRGPDNQSYDRVNDNLILGHTRLSIIDLNDRSNQPFKDEKGNFIVFNGEVYNYKELKVYLQEYSFKTSSDTEVLLYLLDKFGVEKALEKINGMFAFLYWNDIDKKLIVARDRIGKKPLFFAKKENKVYFTSEAKTLVKDGFSFEVNEKAIVNFLFDRRAGIGEDSFFENVKEIENSHYYVFSLKNNSVVFSKKRYYTLSSITTDYSITYNDAKNQFLAAFEDSLNLRLRSDVPIACMLSGGLDSSAIVSKLAKDNPSQEFTAISAIYPGMKSDESQYALEVIHKYKNVKKDFIEMSHDGFFEHLDKTIYAQEMPIADGSMVAHNILMKKISEQNIKVIISGNGGDEVLAGYNTHQNAYYAYLISRLKFDKLNIEEIKYGIYHLLPSLLKQKIKNAIALRSKFLTEPPKLRLRYDIYDNNYNDGDIVNFYLKMSLKKWTIPGFVWYEDRNSMAYSIEVRSPFLDYKLIETMLKIPGKYKLDTEFTKKILRDTMRGVLPDKILYRRDKQGFHSPIDVYEKFINYNEILDDNEFRKKFYYLDISNIVKSDFIYRWRIFSIYKWYKIFFTSNV